MTYGAAVDQLGPIPEFLRSVGEEPATWVRMSTGDEMWVVRDHDLGRLVLTDPRFSRAAATRPQAPKFNTANPAPSSIMSMDGGDHARLRRLVSGVFTPRRLAAWAPFVERLTGELLDSLAEAGPPADLIACFATPLPMVVVTTLLGIPVEDREAFQSCVEVLFDISASSPLEKAQRGMELVDYMSALIERKQHQPADDLLGTLIEARTNGTLSKTELVDLGLALLMAGYETTVGQIGLSVLWYLTDPSLRAEMSGGDVRPELVDELLRLTPAAPVSFPRVALEDVPLGSVTIRAGQGVVVSLLHANRDHAAFPDPDRLVPQGRTAPHLTFGVGPHYCVGAPLARIQVKVALSRLIQRFPGLRLAGDSEAVHWKQGLATRGLARLYVSW